MKTIDKKSFLSASTSLSFINIQNLYSIMFTLSFVSLWILSVCFLHASHSNSIINAAPIQTPIIQNSKFITATHGAVASENQVCSQIGVDIMKIGGNSVDAVIATGFCIGTLNFYSSGIGGGGFMLIRTANGSSEVIDFREEAGAQAFPEMFVRDPLLAQWSGLAVGVPGELRGFELAHQRHGKLPWKTVVQPSIRLSEEGWAVSSHLADKIRMVYRHVYTDPAFTEVISPRGRPLVEGEQIFRKTYAKTLKIIAEEGVEVFYTGRIADSLLKKIHSANGTLTKEDFARYRPKLKEAVVGYYHGKKVLTCPLPASGPVLISALNILEGFSLDQEKRTDLNVHRMVETMKFAYAQRTYYGDPSDKDFPNITTFSNENIKKQIAYGNRNKIQSSHTLPLKNYGPVFDVVEDHGTMHVSVIGADSSAVSMTSTVNLLFGSQLMDPETGIILNNQMDDFSLPNHSNAFGYAPSPYNFVKPFKKPLSSSVPTIVELNGKVLVVIGASGGSRIISSTLQSLINVLHYDMNIFDAIEDPLRLHHQLLPNEISIEATFTRELENTLLDKGHAIKRLPPGMTLSGVSGVFRFENGTIQAASDPRKGGGAAGY